MTPYSFLRRNTRATNVLLAVVENKKFIISRVNESKCEVIATNRNEPVSFEDGSQVTHVDKAIDLGCVLTTYINPVYDIQNGLAGCMPTLKEI